MADQAQAPSKLGLTIVRPNLFSMPEMVGNWMDGYTSCRYSAPTSFLVYMSDAVPVTRSIMGDQWIQTSQRNIETITVLSPRILKWLTIYLKRTWHQSAGAFTCSRCLFWIISHNWLMCFSRCLAELGLLISYRVIKQQTILIKPVKQQKQYRMKTTMLTVTFPVSKMVHQRSPRSFCYQDFPGPNWFSRTFQGLENPGKKSRAFQDAWEPWEPETKAEFLRPRQGLNTAS